MTDELPDFEREERYIVVKRKHLSGAREYEFRQWLVSNGIPTNECVVVESDWPEYETVWAMIEARCTGNTRPSTEPDAELVEVANKLTVKLTEWLLMEDVLKDEGHYEHIANRFGEFCDNLLTEALAKQGDAT